MDERLFLSNGLLSSAILAEYAVCHCLQMQKTTMPKMMQKATAPTINPMVVVDIPGCTGAGVGEAVGSADMVGA